MIKELYENAYKLKENGLSIWKIVYKVNKLVVNIIYPISQRFNNKCGVEENNIIVSLTSYPARIKTLWITVASLLNQTYRPSKVVLFLSKEQFPQEELDLPKNLLKQKARGLDIVFVDDDLKPHKKYFYAFNMYRNHIVITADDDILYPENHIEKLIEASQTYPDAIICARSHRIEIGNDNDFQPYNKWADNNTEEPDLLTLPIGCNGVLYKPHMFVEELFSVEKIKDCALYEDDLWLKAMEIKAGIKAYNCCKNSLVYFNNIFTMKTGLWHVNTDNETNGNDIAWRNIIQCYPEVKERLLLSLN